MPFPGTEEGLVAAGYKFVNDSHCAGCGGLVSWWETPSGKRIPLNDPELTPHFATCPQVKDFRSPKPKKG